MSVVSPTILAPLSRLGVVQHGPHLWHEWLSDTFFILPWICRLFTDILTLQCKRAQYWMHVHQGSSVSPICYLEIVTMSPDSTWNVSTLKTKPGYCHPHLFGFGVKRGWFSICPRAHSLVLRVWKFELDSRPHVHGRWSHFLVMKQFLTCIFLHTI